ncbi:hypothetical protein [Liquorilactobacillus mali]|uniref:Uncharacterized protein n=1 Tax=Liquorilactobacillus mali TaxID=1618 RepID=A0A0R2FG06_9LACO|nr:hypothetical protein [Liquorilactobacillus mali]KRN26582.1 hypothetical protein IV36_GL001820 [Liquorilactobacillus mali]
MRNELSRLNTTYSFKIVRITEFTKDELAHISLIGEDYDFTDMSKGGQTPEFLESQNTKMLDKLNG